MSKWPMRGHFQYLRFKTFSMTLRKPRCEVFWALLLNSKHSRVPEDSKSPTLEVLGFTPTLGQSGVATRLVKGLQSHPSSQLFVASDAHQFRHGLAHVRRVATPNGPKKNAISFGSDLTRVFDTVPSFVQWDVAECLPVVRKVALGTNVGWLGNGIAAIRPRMRSHTFEASTTVQHQRTILTRETHVSITIINITHETIGFFRSSKSTKIRQGCVIFVHERGEHRATRTEHRQWQGGLLWHYSDCRR